MYAVVPGIGEASRSKPLGEMPWVRSTIRLKRRRVFKSIAETSYPSK